MVYKATHNRLQIGIDMFLTLSRLKVYELKAYNPRTGMVNRILVSEVREYVDRCRYYMERTRGIQW